MMGIVETEELETGIQCNNTLKDNRKHKTVSNIPSKKIPKYDAEELETYRFVHGGFTGK